MGSMMSRWQSTSAPKNKWSHLALSRRLHSLCPAKRQRLGKNLFCPGLSVSLTFLYQDRQPSSNGLLVALSLLFPALISFIKVSISDRLSWSVPGDVANVWRCFLAPDQWSCVIDTTRWFHIERSNKKPRLSCGCPCPPDPHSLLSSSTELSETLIFPQI